MRHRGVKSMPCGEVFARLSAGLWTSMVRGRLRASLSLSLVYRAGLRGVATVNDSLMNGNALSTWTVLMETPMLSDQHPAEDEVCPVREEFLGQLYRAHQDGLPA